MLKNHVRDSKSYTYLQIEKILNKRVLFSLLILFYQLVIQPSVNKMWWVAERQNMSCDRTPCDGYIFSQKINSYVYRELLVGNRF